MKRKLIIITIVVAVIGLIASLTLLRKSAVRAPSGKQPITKQNAPLIQAGTTPSLTIDSPQPVGDRVTVKKVTLPLHGFVVIRDALSNSIVGASNVIIFPETNDMKIAAPVVVGKSYVAEIHADGDKNGLFDAAIDPPFIVSGKTVSTTFKVK
jgi:hypothetical protein